MPDSQDHKLLANLDLPRCPHCGIAEPHLSGIHRHANIGRHMGRRYWIIYECSVCKGLVAAWALDDGGTVIQFFPTVPIIDDMVPERPREYLSQAQESLAQPAASIVVSASAVDSILKQRGLTEGSLYDRIDKAAEDHLITDDMAKWAHDVRLDANDQRHADEDNPLPTTDDARRCLDFALALAEVLFVLPARVNRGITEATD